MHDNYLWMLNLGRLLSPVLQWDRDNQSHLPAVEYAQII
jgi:hypothetical protein